MCVSEKGKNIQLGDVWPEYASFIFVRIQLWIGHDSKFLGRPEGGLVISKRE